MLTESSFHQFCYLYVIVDADFPFVHAYQGKIGLPVAILDCLGKQDHKILSGLKFR